MTERRSGFTLIELIVVIVIIGILASAVVINASRWPEETRIAKARADIATIMSAINQYRITTGQWPEDLETLTAASDPYLLRLSRDPWHRDYVYFNDTPPEVFSLGPDGEAGTGDDITFYDDDREGGLDS